ncbi:2Fe-2S iron-sulfur cluster-binding protein [Sphaerotilus sp.]|uniref:2Fe-2S iron-sulfur cluster-binding protein n=1 Tax=Sphaerotilus sp. TaxID=2093942 RepID=UPI002ACD91B9|nr:2Fe-2S iron-sulfur cluster-binding protein [Sphaerotilus sp.]MDZ7855161.1 2Fe-2S iron-sulfur cluster-binding protein [Sphaerotilus sp.]
MSAAGQTHRVAIEGGVSFDLPPGEDTLLRAALRAGVGLPHECSVGGCGACRFELVAGELQTLWPQAPGLSERDRKRGKHLACQSRPVGDCTIRVRCDDSYRPVVAPVRQTARLLARRALSPDMSEFTVQVSAGATFRPGQYALLYPLGTVGARAYSMSNLPGADGVWQFIVRRVPGGAGSAALFDTVAVGDALPLDGPYGHAHLRDDNDRDIVCIAGGSGLAPMLSIARGVLAQAAGTRRVRFFHGVRTQADLGSTQVLDGLAGDRLSSTVVLSSPEAQPAWTGRTGFIHEEVERALAPDLARFEFYFAGPPPMVQAVQEVLMLRHRVPFEQIHFDRFF